jgi:hypothetical protein
MEKQIDLNKEVLKKYSAEDLSQWAKDNSLSAADLKEVQAELKKKPDTASQESSEDLAK